MTPPPSHSLDDNATAQRLQQVADYMRAHSLVLTTAESCTGVTDDTDPAIEAGTQCFAWFFASRDGLPEKMFSETRKFSGDRNAIREQAALHALTQIPLRHAQSLRAQA